MSELFDPQSSPRAPQAPKTKAAEEPENPAGLAAPSTADASQPAAVPAPSVVPTSSQRAATERRHRRRVKISAPVRVRALQATLNTEPEVAMTLDVSRDGLLFASSRDTYAPEMNLAVTFPYTAGPGQPQFEQPGRVVRVMKLNGSQRTIAVAFLAKDPFTSALHPVGKETRSARPAPRPALERAARQARHLPYAASRRPFVLIVESDARARVALRVTAEAEGYIAEAVSSAAEAAAVLRHRLPSALIAEAEGGEICGYDLCVMLRRNPRLRRIPIILTTSTGLPSDFSTAHALGATVCISKPLDLDRLANILRALVPLSPR